MMELNNVLNFNAGEAICTDQSHNLTPKGLLLVLYIVQGRWLGFTQVLGSSFQQIMAVRLNTYGVMQHHSIIII